MDNNIQFDEPEYAQSAAHQKGPSGLTGLMIKLKLAKSEAGAQKVLLIVIVACILVMIAVWWSQAGSNSYVIYKLPVVPPQPPAP